jgi:putative membrane protein
MWKSTVVAYFHYAGFMVSFAALAVEALTLKREMSLSDAWKIAIADGLYGISATIILLTGILRVLYFGKGTDYYLNNWAFYLKIGIFIGISLVSLYPTFSFIGWIKGLRQNSIPSLEASQFNRLTWMIRTELLGFISIPLFAAMMARGIGSLPLSRDMIFNILP